MAASLPGKQGDRGLVGVDLGSCEDIGEQPLTDRCHQPCQLAGPASHHVAVDVHPLAAQDHGLAMPGLMIDEAADDKVRQQGATRHDLGQRQINCRSLADLLAGPAGNARTNMPQHAEAGRDVVQHLGDVLADHRLRAAAAATTRTGMMLCRLARDVRGDRRTNAGLARRLQRCRGRRVIIGRFGRVDLVEHQAQLRDVHPL